MITILIGVAGSGKTAVGQELASRGGFEFLDADALHSPEARAAMAAGHPLSDAERRPWLERVAAEVASRVDLVVACSALSREARAVLRRARPDARFVHLRVPREALAARLAGRTGHFFPPGLLDSQLATFEEPRADEHVLSVDADAPLEVVVARVAALSG